MMDAKQARHLVIGDCIRCAFGNRIRPAQIHAIEWPHFFCTTVLKNGELRTVKHKYTALKRWSAARLSLYMEYRPQKAWWFAVNNGTLHAL